MNHKKGNKNVSHITSPTTPMTPITPASTCPLVIEKDRCPPVPEHSPLPPHDGSIPFPYEKPYSSLGELKPAHLISFAHQIANGMVCVCARMHACVYAWVCVCVCHNLHLLKSNPSILLLCIIYMYNVQSSSLRFPNAV